MSDTRAPGASSRLAANAAFAGGVTARPPAQRRGVTLIGAASSIGIRPYDDGTPRGLDRAPAVLREAGLAARLQAQDAGDVLPDAYRDHAKPTGRPRNDVEVARYSSALAERVAMLVSGGRFPLVIGGDCSIILGSLLALRRSGRRHVGLVYLDAHADFATTEESRSGSVASMCLALAVGRGDPRLADLAGEGVPLVRGANVALVGRRDEAEPWYGHAALRTSGILDLPHDAIGASGYARLGDRVLDRVASPILDGFWIHLDADVLSPQVMPAVDSPTPGGPDLDDLQPLLAALIHHPRALGLQLTIYDPHLDPDGASAARLVTLLEGAFASPAREMAPRNGTGQGPLTGAAPVRTVPPV